MEPKIENALGNMPQVIQSIADNFAPVLEKLAGTQSDMKLSFNDLSIDTGTVKAKVSGEIVLSAVYSKQQGYSMKESPELGTSDEHMVSKTVATDVRG